MSPADGGLFIYFSEKSCSSISQFTGYCLFIITYCHIFYIMYFNDRFPFDFDFNSSTSSTHMSATVHEIFRKLAN